MRGFWNELVVRQGLAELDQAHGSAELIDQRKRFSKLPSMSEVG
jgi:hypothetical protein